MHHYSEGGKRNYQKYVNSTEKVKKEKDNFTFFIWEDKKQHKDKYKNIDEAEKILNTAKSKYESTIVGV